MSSGPGEKPPGNAADGLSIIRTCERWKTVRAAIYCGTVVVLAIIVAFVILRIYTYDFWWEVILLFLGPTGLMTTALTLFFRRVLRKDNDLLGRIPGTKFPPNPP